MSLINRAEVAENVEAVETVSTVSFQPYDAKVPPVAETGLRVSKCMYKAAKAGGIAPKENGYVAIPLVSVNELVECKELPQFMPHFVSWIETLQDVIVKKLHGKSVARFSLNAVSLEAVLEHLELEGVSGRLSKEVIECWFSNELESKLLTAFSNKMGIDVENATEEQEMKLLLVLEAYKKKFAMLAGIRTKLPLSEVESLEKALALVDCSKDLVAARLKARLVRMKEEPKEEDELLGL